MPSPIRPLNARRYSIQAHERVDALTEHNNGVYYSEMLQAVPSDEAAVRARGIRRAEDKVRGRGREGGGRR